jgi:hypothetical protein
MNAFLVPILKSRFPSVFDFFQKIDKRLDHYDNEIQLSIWFARLLIGISLVIYGIARQTGLIQIEASRYIYIPPEASPEEAAEAEFNLRRITSIGSLGLGIVVLLPIFLPPLPKGQEKLNSSEYLGANLLHEEWNDRKDFIDDLIKDERRLKEERAAMLLRKEEQISRQDEGNKKDK